MEDQTASPGEGRREKSPRSMSGFLRVRAFEIFLGVVLGLAFCNKVEASSKNDSDKKVHLGLSFATSLGSYGLLRSQGYSAWASTWGALALTTFVGAAKEVTDPHVDPEDLEADATGLGAGLVVAFVVDW